MSFNLQWHDDNSKSYADPLIGSKVIKGTVKVKVKFLLCFN